MYCMCSVRRQADVPQCPPSGGPAHRATVRRPIQSLSISDGLVDAVAAGARGRDVADGRCDDAATIDQDFHTQADANPADLEETAADAGATEMRGREAREEL